MTSAVHAGTLTPHRLICAFKEESHLFNETQPVVSWFRRFELRRLPQTLSSCGDLWHSWVHSALFTSSALQRATEWPRGLSPHSSRKLITSVAPACAALRGESVNILHTHQSRPNPLQRSIMRSSYRFLCRNSVERGKVKKKKKQPQNTVRKFHTVLFSETNGTAAILSKQIRLRWIHSV